MTLRRCRLLDRPDSLETVDDHGIDDTAADNYVHEFVVINDGTDVAFVEVETATADVWETWCVTQVFGFMYVTQKTTAKVARRWMRIAKKRVARKEEAKVVLSKKLDAFRRPWAKR